MAQRIISNQVYYTPQAQTFGTTETTGTIIYANKFAPNGEVKLPNELKELLNSNVGYVGNNVIVQLEQKVQCLPNGPWYVDSRNGMIYIHNRKFFEMPIYTYIYNQENGELIRAEFKTEYIRKHRDGQVIQGLDLDKNFHHAQVNINDLGNVVGVTVAEQNDAVQRAAQDYYDRKITLAQYNAICAANPEAAESLRRNNIMVNQRLAEEDAEKRQALIDDQNLQYSEYDAAEKKQKGSGNQALQDIETDRALKSSDMTKEADRIITQIAIQMAGGNKAKATNYYQGIKQGILTHSKKGDLEDWCKAFFSATHEMNAETWTTTNQPYQVHEETFTRSSATPGFDDSRYNDLKNSADVKIIEERTNTTKWTDSDGTPQTTTTTTVKYMKREQINFDIPQYKVVLAGFSQRYGGGSIKDVEARIIAAGNSQKAVVERKLVVKIEVVGNPFLETSKVINILNVGKRWQGSWYIKAVSHLMTAGKGYTTQVELVKNGSKAGSSSVSGSVKMADVHSTTADTGAKTYFTADDEVYYSMVAAKAKQTGDTTELTELAYALASGKHVQVNHNTTTSGITSDKGSTHVVYNVPKTTQEERQKAQKVAMSLVDQTLNANPNAK